MEGFEVLHKMEGEKMRSDLKKQSPILGCKLTHFHFIYD